MINQLNERKNKHNLKFDELEKIAKGDYIDAAGNVYSTPEDFDTNQWRKSYREGQEQGDSMKSSYSMNKSPILDMYERKIIEIQNDSTLSDTEKESLIKIVNEKIKGLTQ